MFLVKLTFVAHKKTFKKRYFVSLYLYPFLYDTQKGPKFSHNFTFLTDPKFDSNVSKTHDIASLMVTHCDFNKKISKINVQLVENGN